jgi:hypothetical protein
MVSGAWLVGGCKGNIVQSPCDRRMENLPEYGRLMYSWSRSVESALPWLCRWHTCENRLTYRWRYLALGGFQATDLGNHHSRKGFDSSSTDLRRCVVKFICM